MNIVEDIDRDYVVVVGMRVLRPSGVAPMQWLEFWEETQLEHDGDGAVIPMTPAIPKKPQRKR